MNKRVTFEDISAYYDGESDRNHLVAHRLREDDTVRRLYQGCTGISAHFNALAEPAVRPNFAGDVIRAIEARAETPTASWWSSVVRPLATAAAFVLFAGFVAVGIYSTSDTPGDAAAPVAAADSRVEVAATDAEPAIAGFWRESNAQRARENAALTFASDSQWLFADTAVEEAKELSHTDELLLALAEVKYFDRPVSPPLDSGADIRAAITNLDDAASRTFVLLLNDYARDGSAL